MRSSQQGNDPGEERMKLGSAQLELAGAGSKLLGSDTEWFMFYTFKHSKTLGEIFPCDNCHTKL